MNEPLFISFATQKGGAGKTTLTVLVASYLYYVRKKKVLVVDCDYPQYSVKEMRDRDVAAAKVNDWFRRTAMSWIELSGGEPYPILICRPEDAMGKVKGIIDSGKEFDVVLFDLPGTINNPDVVSTVSLMDYIFCPVSADQVILESSLAFAMKLRDEIMPLNGCSIKQLYMLWNQVDGREKTRLYDLYEEVFEEQLLPTLNTRMPDQKRFRREGDKDSDRIVFRSTFMPPDKKLLKGSNIFELVCEICDIIQLD